MENISSLLSFYRNVHRETLSNGLVVLLYPTPHNPIVNYQLWVKTGSVHEDQYLGAGVSHCLEHCVFLGSKRFPRQGECSEFIELRGGADNNAHTSYEHTAFHFSLNHKYLDDGLIVLSDIIFHPIFPRKRFFKEKNVILSEMDMDLDDPEALMSQDFLDKMYPHHPYRFPIIGYRDSFVDLSHDDILTYFEKKYTPDNMVIALTGGFEVDKAMDLIAEHFGKSRRGWNPLPAPFESSIGSGWAFPPVNLDLELPRIKMGFPGCDILSEDGVVLDLIDVILSYGKNSYFYKKYLQDHFLNHVETHSWTPRQAGYFEIALSGSWEQLKNKRLDILKDLHTFVGELRDEDIEGAKLKIYQDITFNLESPIGVNQSLIANEVFTGNFHFEYDYLLKLKNVDRSNLAQVVEKYFGESKLIFCEYHPLQAAKVITKPTVEKKIATIPCQRFCLANGLEVVYKNEATLNIYLNLIFKGGLEYEQERDNGLFPLLATMLLQGTKGQTETEIASFFENLGCSITPFCYDSSFGFSLSFLKRDEKKVYEKLVEILNDSIFPKDKLGILKQKALDDLKLEDENIWEIHSRIFKTYLFKSSILRLNAHGDENSLKNITREDILNHHQQHTVAQNGCLGLVGDVDRTLIHDIFSRLISGQGAKLPIYQPTILTFQEPISKILAKEQTIYRMGFETASFETEDKKYLDLLSFYFNGLGGPLFKIREMTGDAYHISCAQVSRRMTGHFIFTFVLAAHSFKDALWVKKIVLKLLEKIKKQRLKRIDIKRALNSMKGEKAIAQQSPADFCFQIAQYELLGQGFEHYHRECDFPEENFTFLSKRLKTLADTYFKDDNFILVSVGAKP